MTELDKLKIILREKDIPYFEDDELNMYLEEYGTAEKAAYQCLIIKSQNLSMSVGGVSTPDNAKYFLRLAQKYRPNHSGILE